MTATSKREPEIKLEVFPDGEFQAVCDCGWKSDKSLDQEFIYDFAAKHSGVTGHEFAPGHGGLKKKLEKHFAKYEKFLVPSPSTLGEG